MRKKQLKAGIPLFISDKEQALYDHFEHAAIRFAKQGKRVLYIDTSLAHTPYHRNIFSLVAPDSYTLWKTLGSISLCITSKDIDVLLIPCLTSAFEDTSQEDVAQVLNHITKKIKRVAFNHRLLTVIGMNVLHWVSKHIKNKIDVG